MFPARRKEDLIIQQVDDETLVYNRRNDQAHCLSRTAAAVWALCDGSTTIEDIASALHHDLAISGGSAVALLALRDLEKAGLLEPGYRAPATVLSRREVAKRLGLAAAIALPLISTIVAPSPLMAASCIPAGGVCGNNQGQGQGLPCCGGHQCNNNRCT